MNKLLGYMFAIELVIALYAAVRSVHFEQKEAHDMIYLLGKREATGRDLNVALSKVPHFIAQNFPSVIYLIKFGNWILLLM